MFSNLKEDLGYKKVGDRKIKMGLFLCNECGLEFKVQIRKNTKAKHCKSCSTKKTKTKHGKTHTKLYFIWHNIKDRCKRKRNKSYLNYGGRGIKICKEWLKFEAFYCWCISNGYKEGLSIDRIDNDGNYEPSNCRWTTKNIQARNSKILRSTNTSGFKGVSAQNNGFVARIMVDKKSIFLGTFKTAETAARVYDGYVIENGLEHTRNFND